MYAYVYIYIYIYIWFILIYSRYIELWTMATISCYFMLFHGNRTIKWIHFATSMFPGWWFEPLWKIWKSIGMMKFPIYGKIKFMFQTTNQFHIDSEQFCFLNHHLQAGDFPTAGDQRTRLTGGTARNIVFDKGLVSSRKKIRRWRFSSHLFIMDCYGGTWLNMIKHTSSVEHNSYHLFIMDYYGGTWLNMIKHTWNHLLYVAYRSTEWTPQSHGEMIWPSNHSHLHQVVLNPTNQKCPGSPP